MKNVHLIGVCGTAMATLAVLLRERGYNVRGSDEHVYPPMCDLLTERGIVLLPGYRAEHISDDLNLVVIGNAVSRGNPEVEAVLERKLRYASLPELMRNEFLWHARSIVVAGTHGKTTTAFMVAWVLTEAGHDPSFLVGGVSRNFETSGRLGTGESFVIEGDEYDSAFFDKTAKFLKYLPDVVIVNNLEFDHADIYRDLDELRLAFRRLVRLIPRNGRLLVSADDAEALALADAAHCPVETFGLDGSAQWMATNLSHGAEETRFEVVREGSVVAHVALPILGAFNVRNAIGAMAGAAARGIDPQVTAGALATFRGVKRRLEVRGVVAGITVYDDFAHHPTAVRETLAGLRAADPPGRIWALFEPRSATACRRVFQDAFAESFRLAHNVVIAAVHRSGIPAAERLSEGKLVSDLIAAGVKARFVPTVDEVVSVVVEEAQAGDQIVVMSNGAFEGIHDRLLQGLSAR